MSGNWRRLAAALTVLASVTALLRWLAVSNAGTVSTSYLLVVLVVAATSRVLVAIVTSIAAMLCLNFFFLPPIGNLTIAEPHNRVALFAFLAVSLVASHLSAVAHARTEEAVGRRDELARLFDLSRDVLMMTDSPEALAVLARSVARRFVRMSGEGLLLAVRDHGPGIAPADLPHVFERFYRGSSAKARASGTGMGLWIVRGLLAVEQGRVWAENCPDGGARFTIVVPAAQKDVS